MHSIETYEEQKAIFEEFNINNSYDLPKTETARIAVCTCKGGVGKTTVSAHLAGAFTLTGHETALIDCDPENHLIKLLDPGILDTGEGDGILLDDSNKALTCYTKKSWFKEDIDSYPVAIFDCAPSKESNDPKIFLQCDFCIIPINLCPLGVGKNIDVIKDTFTYIKNCNPSIQCLILINNRMNREHKVAISLKHSLKEEAKKCGAHLIQPDIRHSEQLYYWGAEPKKLAFRIYAGRCHPKEDFTNLAEYLIRYLNLKKKRTSKLKLQKRLMLEN